MPSSIFDPVSSALHLSLTADDKNQNDLLDNRLISSAKSVLLSNIEFEEAGTYQTDVLDGLKSKYIILKAEKRHNDDKTLKKELNSSFSTVRAKPENSLPSPKKVLYPISAIRLGWQSGWQVGSGMQNIGNTCYLNSTLQALFHVPAFSNWLMSEAHHADKCTPNGGCVICAMRKTLLDTQNSNGPIKPWQVYSKLRLICRHLTPGRQEDAHEFLRYLVESMEKTYLSCLGGAAKQLEQYSKETTPLNQLLGGYLRSAVRCLACGAVSTTFQHFQDLLVDARKASNLDEAMDSFFSKERLEDLGYKCETCKKKVSATKQFFVERAPMVLCIALKRFSSTGGKVSKHINFKSRISLKKFMFQQESDSMLTYRLVSVVTHLGSSQNCGHYTAVGLGPGGKFYHFDDSCVRELSSMANVLNTNAYIMFYELEKADNFNKNKFINQPSPVKTILLSKRENEESLLEKRNNFIGPLPEKNKENSPSISKFSQIKINGSNDVTSVPNSTYCSLENTSNVTPPSKSSSNMPSLDKPQSKLTLNLLSTPSLADSSSYCPSGKPNIKPTYSNDNSPLRKTTMLSPIKSINSIPNGFGPKLPSTQTDNKPNTEIKTSADSQKQNGSSHENGDVKTKHKIKSDENKHNPLTNGVSKPIFISNGNSSQSQTNGTHKAVENGLSKKSCGLVPYSSESGEENCDDEDEDDSSIRNKLSAPRPQPALPRDIVTTKATDHSWKVSHIVPVAHHSPSLNGVVNSKLLGSSEACNEQPTSLNGGHTNGNGHGHEWGHSNGGEGHRDVVAHLQRQSHRGYGAPVPTWKNHHSQLNRQVYEDKKNQLKRSIDDDEMDRGRVKKMHHNNYNGNKHYNNDFNAFQDVQNQRIRWTDHNKGSNRPFPFNKHHRHGGRGRYVPPYHRQGSGSGGGNHYNHNNHHHHYSRNH